MGLITITAGQSFTGRVGVAFSQTPAYTGTIRSWGATGLPNGLAINATSGLISGTPTARGNSTATLTGTGPFAATKIAAGNSHSLALKNDGTVFGWSGWNHHGQATIPPGLSGVVDISAHGDFSLALKSDGTVVGWGFNEFGEATVPSGLSGVVAISAGHQHGLALKNDGTVVGWGRGYYNGGDMTIPSGLSGVVAISAGYAYALALKSDGTVVAWGGNSFSAISTPSGVVAILARQYNALALKSDGTVVGLGATVPVPSGLSGVVAIAGGHEHSLALKSDGTVVAWGNNLYGQSTVPSGLSGVIAICASWYHSLALKSDGKIIGWGEATGVREGITTHPDVGESASATLLLTITGGPPIIVGGQSFTGKVGVAFTSATLTLDNALGDPVTSWGALGLPAGLSLNTTTGAITGTPTAKGSFIPRFSAISVGGTSAEVEASISIADGVPLITASQTASGTVGTAFSKTFSLTDSTNRPVTSWAATGLPSWATLNTTTGAITGTPQDSGSATISLTATGPGGTSEATTATISIAVGPPIITVGQSFTGKVGVAFTQTPTLDDALDRPATSWSVTGLPAGLSLNTATGAITGTPTAKGSFIASFTATGGGGTSAASSVAFTITDGVPIITASQTASGTVGTAFSKTFSLTDSTNRPVTSWAATGLPSWATLKTTTGAITGTPQDTGSATISLTATGPGGTSAATTATISIAVGPPIIVAGQSFTGKVGVAFTQTPTLDDALDRPATSWSATGLPAGLSLNTATGAITGTPTAKGSFTASFTATGGGGTSAASSVAFTITDGVPIITASQTASGTVGTAFSKTFSLTDSTNRPVTSWAATGLPSWATLNTTTGAITGTPQDSGSATISLTATGAGGTSEVTTATISIAVGPPIIVAGQSFTGKVGVAFTQTPTLDDALDRPAASWSVTGLPAGLSLNTATGAITGTPTAKGSFTASFTATGGGGTSAARSVAFTITDGVPIITLGQQMLFNEQRGFSYLFQSADASNRAVTDWSATGLPQWASLSSNGVLSGVAGGPGVYLFSITATGPGGVDTDEVQAIVLEYTPYVYRGTGVDGRVWRSVVNAGVPVHNVHGFMYGEFVLGAVGVLDVLFYTTWNGRVTPQPLCGLGIKTYVDTLNPGCDAYRASTATALGYDFKSESATAPVVKMALPCSGKSYGLYNIWGLPNMPDKGEVRAHISIQARP